MNIIRVHFLILKYGLVVKNLLTKHFTNEKIQKNIYVWSQKLVEVQTQER
jgi:hypothetical protein